MKILQVSHNYHIVGGSDAVFFATIELLESAGHDVIPFCIDTPKNRPTRWDRYFPKAANSRTAPMQDGLRYFYNSDARSKLNALLDAVGQIDVAHLHIYHGKQTPSILPELRAHGIPIVQTLHEYKLACPVYTLQRDGQPCQKCVTGTDLNCVRHRCKDGSLVRSLVMAAEKATSRILGDVRQIDRFLCVSEFQRRIMARAGLPLDRLFTLHNFVDSDQKPDPGHDGYYLYFGRIEALKGIEMMIDAFKRCDRRLLIAGDGDYRQKLEVSISAAKNIEYLGFQSGKHLTQLIRRSKAVVVPSQWYENCPMSLLEAKSNGRPVIGANIGGIPELIQHKTDGYLFEPGDISGLIAAIDSIENEHHATMAIIAWEDARARFSARTHLNALLSHYSAAIENSRHPILQPA